MVGLAHRHRDAYGRVVLVDEKDAMHDRYMRPSDGKLATVLVQESDESSLKPSPPGRTRTGKMQRKVSPVLDLVYWTYSSVLKEGSEERDYDAMKTSVLLVKWIPSCVILAIMVCTIN